MRAQSMAMDDVVEYLAASLNPISHSRYNAPPFFMRLLLSDLSWNFSS